MEAYATLAGFPVIEARIAFPRVGVWNAELRLDTPTPPTGKQILILGTARFAGVVASASSWEAVSWVRMRGGAGGLGRVLPSKGYGTVPISVPLSDIARETGERLAASSDAGVTGFQLQAWARMESPGGQALGLLLEQVAGAAWRFLPSGELWVGKETWPTSKASVELTDFEPLRDAVTFFAAAPVVFPGSTFLEKRVEYMEHLVSESRVESVVYFGEAA